MASRKYTWDLCSQYNRRKNVDHSGYGPCASCGKVIHWSDGDAGHFIQKAKGKAIYWLPDNIHLQCRGCNRDSNQEMVKIRYTRWMSVTFGDDLVDRLIAASRTTYHESQVDIDHWAGFYKAELKKLGTV